MSFEIGMKSLLQKMHSDFPKSHSVEDFFVVYVEKNPQINQETDHVPKTLSSSINGNRFNATLWIDD